MPVGTVNPIHQAYDRPIHFVDLLQFHLVGGADSCDSQPADISITRPERPKFSDNQLPAEREDVGGVLRRSLATINLANGPLESSFPNLFLIRIVVAVARFAAAQPLLLAIS
jgi:hypothetical protein